MPPKLFTFSHVKEPNFPYYARQEGDRYIISWSNSPSGSRSGPVQYTAEDVQRYIKKKQWIVKDTFTNNQQSWPLLKKEDK